MNKKLLTAACAITIGCASATAQYSDIANGIANVLMPAVSGAANYKGFVEAVYRGGYQSNIVLIGLGVNVSFEW